MRRGSGAALARDGGPAAVCEARLVRIGEAEVADGLRQAMVASGLTGEDGPLCRTLRPKFVAEPDYRRLTAAAKTALDLFGRAERRVRADAALRHALFGAHPYAPLIEAHLDHEVESVGRFDTLVDLSGRLRFIEYNAGLCGGIFCSEALAGIFAESPLLAPLHDSHSLRFIGLSDRYLQTLMRGFRRARGRLAANLAIILPPGEAGRRFAGNAELRAMIAFARGKGIAARFANLEGLLERAGSLVDSMGEIDLAIVVDWAATLAACPLHHILWQARAERGTWIANSLGASVLRSGKHLLAVLSDPAYGLLLRRRERAWIDSHIPWSRLLAHRPIMAGGAERDLVDWVRDNRRSLVVKPCFSMGGRGVALGWECSGDAWEQAVDQALLTPSIVQERVVTAPETYPVATAAGVEWRALTGDLCLFTWGGEQVGGLYCRLAETGLLNLSASGGMLVPAFVAGAGAAAAGV